MNRQLNMKKYLQEYLPLYVFVSVLFIIGVIFGALLVNALSLEQKRDLSGFMGSFLNMMNQGLQGTGFELFKQSFGTNIKWILLIWVLGLSVIGLPIIFILNFLKGVLIGFTVGYLVGELSWKGFAFSLVAVAPQNLVMIPVLIICSVSAMAFYMHLIRHRFMQKKGSISSYFKSYCVLSLALVTVVFGVSLFEGFISPVLMEWAAPRLLS